MAEAEDEENQIAISKMRFSLHDPAGIEFLKPSELEIKKRLGKGSFATVYKAYIKGRPEPYALKIIPKGKTVKLRNEENVQKEIEITQEVHHPFIMETYAVMQDAHRIYILMEYCHDGSLFHQY